MKVLKIFIGVIFILFIGQILPYRFDSTSDKRFEISNETELILKELE